jgi:outer membrane protein TolC
MNQLHSYVLKLYLIGLILLPPVQGFAQDNQSLILSLEDAIEIALEQNFDIEQAEYDEDKTRAQFRQTNAVFLPQLSFEYNALSTNDPLNVFGFKLKQETVTQQDFNPALLNNPDSYENYSAVFKIQQPLFNPDMIMQRIAARDQLRSSKEQLLGTKNYIRYQVQNQYLGLILRQRQLDVIESALQTAGEHRRQAQNFYEEGMISKEDMLAARVYELEMESRKLTTENEREQVEENLALLLGLDGENTIVPSDSLQLTPAPRFEESDPAADVNNAQTRAIEYRVQAAERMVTSSDFSFLPKINLFGSYEYNDIDFASFGASSYMIGANLSWNIFSGFSKVGKSMEARADLHKARSMQENHQFEQENRVRQAIRALEHAEQELELTEESIRQSTEDVKIRSNRYAQGMEKTTDLMEAETKLAEAKLKHVMALFKHNMSIAALNMLLETNF